MAEKHEDAFLDVGGIPVGINLRADENTGRWLLVMRIGNGSERMPGPPSAPSGPRKLHCLDKDKKYLGCCECDKDGKFCLPDGTVTTFGGGDGDPPICP